MKFDRAILQDRLLKLSNNNRIAFSLSVCERLYPNYLAFFNQTRWGDPLLMRKIIDTIWDYLIKPELDKRSLESLKAMCEHIIPDTEDFDTILVSSALDASCCVLNTLNYLTEKDLENIVDNGSLAIDTVDMYLQHILNLDYSDKDLELKISTHTFMLKELKRQDEDLIYLNISNLSPDLITMFRENSKCFKSNIDL